MADTVAESITDEAAADSARMALNIPVPVVSAVELNIVISPSLVTTIRSWRALFAVPSPMAKAAELPVEVLPSPRRLYCPNTVAVFFALLYAPCAKE